MLWPLQASDFLPNGDEKDLRSHRHSLSSITQHLGYCADVLRQVKSLLLVMP